MPGGDVRSEVGFFVVPHRRGAETNSHKARNHRDLVAPETRGLRLWLGRWLKCEDAKGKACNSKGVQSWVEREPAKALWVIGQNDGPR